MWVDFGSINEVPKDRHVTDGAMGGTLSGYTSVWVQIHITGVVLRHFTKKEKNGLRYCPELDHIIAHVKF